MSRAFSPFIFTTENLVFLDIGIMSFHENVKSLSRNSALFWGVFLASGALVFLVVQNTQLRHHIKALETSKAIHITSSVRLNPLEIKAMMEDVLRKMPSTAPAAGRKAPPEAPAASIEDFCGMKVDTLTETARGLGMTSIKGKTRYNRTLDRCFVDMRSAYSDSKGQEWAVRVLYDGGNDKLYGEFIRLLHYKRNYRGISQKIVPAKLRNSPALTLN